MTLCERLKEHIAAAFTGLWIHSFEHEDALAEIAALCGENDWSLAVWDIDRGLQTGGEAGAAAATDPVAAVKAINALGSPDGTAVLALPNFHRFLSSAEVVQAVTHQIQQGKQNRTFLLILSPVIQIPIELEHSSSSSSMNCPAASNWKRSPGASPPSPVRCRRTATCTACWMPRPG